MYKKLKEAITFSVPQRLLTSRDKLLAPKAKRLVLVSDRDAYCSEQQFAPFYAHRTELRNQFKLVLEHRLLSDVLADPVACLTHADVVGLKLSFRTRPEDALHITQRIATHAGSAHLVYFDGDDDSMIQWPAILPWVDLYVKKHLFRDPSAYGKRFVGRNNLTDYVSREYGWDFSADPIPASAPVDPRYHDKLHLGYNIALDGKIVDLYRRTKHLYARSDGTDRPYDIVCRASVDSWLTPLRAGIEPALAGMRDKYSIITPIKRVEQRTYDLELSRSKICICPFGYGEICWRDFEAVLWGCLVVKPRMDAICTKPDIFVPGETYVPVRWDLSDLAETCHFYLEHPDERQRIVHQAYEVLSKYYDQNSFLDEVAQILGRLGVHSDGVTEQPAASPQLLPEFVGRESRT